MDKKCNKFEAMFVFAEYKDFQKHLSECNDCQAEYLKMNKVSSLVREVAPIYLQKEKRTKFKIIMSCCLFLFFGLVSIIGFTINNNFNHESVYSDSSVVYEAGLPVDEYGLLKI